MEVVAVGEATGQGAEEQGSGWREFSLHFLSFSSFLDKNLFDPSDSDNYAAFKNWLQCYLVPGMSSLRDRNKRTIWFQVGVWSLCLGLGTPIASPRG